MPVEYVRCPAFNARRGRGLIGLVLRFASAGQRAEARAGLKVRLEVHGADLALGQHRGAAFPRRLPVARMPRTTRRARVPFLCSFLRARKIHGVARAKGRVGEVLFHVVALVVALRHEREIVDVVVGPIAIDVVDREPVRMAP